MRWFVLTPDHLKASGYGSIVDGAKTRAVGSVDPVGEAIANAVARVRRAIAPGNVLDADGTKIPVSLKGVAESLALFALMARIGLPQSDDQKQTARDITSELNRVSKEKVKVELPDDPESTPTMGATGMKVSTVNVPCRQTGRERTNGL